MQIEFTTFDIVKALKITRERLHDWMTRGFVRPTEAADGQGTKARFTLTDVYGVALFRCLLDLGFVRTVASDYVNLFMQQEEDAPDHQKTDYVLLRIGAKDGRRVSVLTITGGDMKIDLETGTVDQVKILSHLPRHRGLADKNWRIIHIINFATLRAEVDSALARL